MYLHPPPSTTTPTLFSFVQTAKIKGVFNFCFQESVQNNWCSRSNVWAWFHHSHKGKGYVIGHFYARDIKVVCWTYLTSETFKLTGVKTGWIKVNNNIVKNRLSRKKKYTTQTLTSYYKLGVQCLMHPNSTVSHFSSKCI